MATTLKAHLVDLALQDHSPHVIRRLFSLTPTAEKNLDLAARELKVSRSYVIRLGLELLVKKLGGQPAEKVDSRHDEPKVLN